MSNLLSNFVSLTIAVGCFLGASPINAAAEPDIVPERSTEVRSVIELVSYTDFAPYITDTLPGGGMISEIVRAAFAHENIALKVNNVPWKRAYRLVIQGQVIGGFSWVYTPERANLFHLSDALFADTNILYTTLPDVQDVASLEARVRSGKVTILCIPHGWTVAPIFTELIEAGLFTRVAPEKISSCLELMNGGRAHFISVSPLTVAYELNALQKRAGDHSKVISTLHLVPPLLDTPSTLHVIFAKTGEGKRAAAQFQRGFDAIVSNGIYVEIIERYLTMYPSVDRQHVFENLARVGLTPKR